MINVGNPAAQHILRIANPPKFSGRLQEWAQFKEDWERYLRKLGTSNEISDSQKLELLENCLDEVSQKQLRLCLKESGGRLTFNEEWSKLDMAHSRNQGPEKMARIFFVQPRKSHKSGEARI